MAHIAKYAKSSIGHLTKHFERAKDESGQYINFGNKEIDTTKTKFNYNLAPARDSQVEFIRKRISEVRCLKRDDVKVMCDWIVTVPRTLPESNYDLFFRETYAFLENRYGKENVISSYVHLDESTPHMHFAFIPVVFDKKKNVYKVSAKELINKKELQSFHLDLDNHLFNVFGENVGVLNGATKDGNKEIYELKRASRVESLNALDTNISKKTNALNNLKKQITIENNELNKVKSKYEGVILTEKKINKINPEKTILGGIKNVSVDDIKNLKKTAIIAPQLNSELNIAKKNIEELKEINLHLVQENQAKSKELSKYTGLNAKIKRTEELKELEYLRELTKLLPDTLLKRLENQLKQHQKIDSTRER